MQNIQRLQKKSEPQGSSVHRSLGKEPSMYYIDTELYIEGSHHGNAAIGDTETVDDRTIEAELKNSDITLKRQSLNRPR